MKKYWLKLDKDFLKSPQMKIIKDMQNGKDYIIFYLSLMLESIETVGHLRFTSLVPYNAEMLASITDTNVDIVRQAIKIFCELGLMQIFDDGTIFMTEVPKITGKESESAERVRAYRLRQKDDKMLQCNNDVTKCNNNININKNKNKDKNKEINIYKKKYFENEEVNNIFIEFLQLRKKLRVVNTDRAINLLINKLNKYDDNIKIKMLEQSIMNSWKSVYELKNKEDITPTWFNEEKEEKEEKSDEEYEQFLKNIGRSN